MKMSDFQFVTWEMDAGLFIISPQKFKQDSIDLLKQLLEFHTRQQLMYGHLLAWFMKC